MLYPSDHLKYPMKRDGKRGEGKFERITWEEAIDTIAAQVKRTGEEYGPESRYVNYASGQAWVYSNEGFFCRKLFSYLLLFFVKSLSNVQNFRNIKKTVKNYQYLIVFERK